tara:strand:- start:77 stop:199 length:123 start_codon:yes stop_codon:yes gene_type:complete
VIQASEQVALLSYAWVDFDVVGVLAVADAWVIAASAEISM